MGLIILISHPAYSIQNNPQIRQCHLLNGEFFVADGESDQFGFCRFDDAIIGTIDLLRYDEGHADVLSIEAFKKNVLSCEPFGQLTELKIPDGPTLQVCEFTDNSMIEIKTLELGLNSEKNKKLTTALGLSR